MDLQQKTGLQYAVLSAIGLSWMAGRCAQKPNLVTLAPVQVALAALAVTLTAYRAPYFELGLPRVGRVISKVVFAAALSPALNPQGWARFEEKSVAPLFAQAGLDPSAPLSMLQVIGLSSVLGYCAFVEAARLLLEPPPVPAQQPQGLRWAVLALEPWHNLGLALMSVAMLGGVARSCVVSGKLGDAQALLCRPFQEDTIFLLTAHCFFWTKLWEWGDTALLVAKGKPVTWLHYTHHMSTAILTMLNMVPVYNAMWSVVCATNSFVHAWMYAYYWKPAVLRQSRRWITRIQIVQHVTVLASTVYVLRGGGCANTLLPIAIGQALYGMYLLFFLAFYIDRYVRREKAAPPAAAAAAGQPAAATDAASKKDQ